jgi:7-carboxy-7-deazaguanine synthase
MQEEKVKLPVAEVFHSIQGEGVWTGTAMLFVRLAGCNVGTYANDLGPADVPDPKTAGISLADLPLLQSRQHSICRTADGQAFLCDTDYHRSADMTIEEILSELREKHVCVTGGEPLLHGSALRELFDALAERNIMTHIETSGTRPLGEFFFKMPVVDHPRVWITCSPKKGFLPTNHGWIDEWKFLVGPGFSEEKLIQSLNKLPDPSQPVYLQPVNPVTRISQTNVCLCRMLQEIHPEWRLSIQVHKVFGLR